MHLLIEGLRYTHNEVPLCTLFFAEQLEHSGANRRVEALQPEGQDLAEAHADVEFM